MSRPRVPGFDFFVTPLGDDESSYDVQVRCPDETVLSGRLEFPERAQSVEIVTSGARLPSPFGLIRGQRLREMFERWSIPAEGYRLDISLPADPIALLDWEGIGGIGCSVFRRPLGNAEVRITGEPLNLPLRWGMLSSSRDPEASTVVGAVRHAVSAVRGGGLVEFALEARPASVRESLGEIRSAGVHALHVIADAGFENGVPSVRLGEDVIAIEDFITATSRMGIRLLTLQDASESPEVGMAALRLGAQKVPAKARMATVVCSLSPARAGASDFLAEVYGGVLRDEPLGDIVRNAGRYGISACAVANKGIETGLGVSAAARVLTQTEVTRRVRQSAQLRALVQGVREDPRRAASWPEQSLEAIDQHSKAAEAALQVAGLGEAEAGLEDLARIGDAIASADRVLRTADEIVRSAETGDTQAQAPPPRYPAAVFYKVRLEEQQPIVPSVTLSPPPDGWSLEFHFWLDLVEGGIEYYGERPQFTSPPDLPYPVLLSVDVWSQDFRFSETSRQVQLEYGGPTEHARFPIELPVERDLQTLRDLGVLFVFLRLKNELLAVFRVEAKITAEPQQMRFAQKLEHAYLATNWFRFDRLPTGAALTLYFRKEAGHLQVFTLRPSRAPWGRLGVTEADFHQRTKEIYRAIQALALKAAQAEERGETLGFVKGATSLAKEGYQLFTALFHLNSDDEVKEFSAEVLKPAGPNTSVTIAIDETSREFIIPWGLVYDRRPPSNWTEDVEVGGFWGTRFDLTVRPSVQPSATEARPAAPPVLATAYLDHPQTKRMEELLRKLETNGKIRRQELRVENGEIPGLVNSAADFVHFFCHGHTQLYDRPLERELVEEYRKYLQQGPAGPSSAREVLQHIEGPQVADSFVYCNGGIADLASLSESIRRLPRAPLVLLSMCESAQVSCSGVSFVTFFLNRGARAVIGTEGPSLWSLAFEMDRRILGGLLEGKDIRQAFSEARRELVKQNVLALIYTLFGEGHAKLCPPTATSPASAA